MLNIIDNIKEFFIISKVREKKFIFDFSNWLTGKLYKNEISEPFKKLFYKKEIGELFGPKNSNFYKVTLLYITLFIAVGFGIQSKKYFNEQLGNPFVTFIQIPMSEEVNMSGGDKTQQVIDSVSNRYLEESFRKKYKIDTVQTYSSQVRLKLSSNHVKTEFTGMAINYNSDLLNEAVFKSKIIGEPYTDVDQRSIVVTLNLLKDLYLVDQEVSFEDLNPDSIPGYIMYQPYSLYFEVPILIQAVAKQLPWGNDFILPLKLSDHIGTNPNLVFNKNTNDPLSFYIKKEVEVDSLTNMTINFLQEYGVSANSKNCVVEETHSLHKMILVSITKLPRDNSFADTLKAKIKNNFSVKDDQIINAHFKSYRRSGPGWTGTQGQQSGIFVVFSGLKKVNLFNEDLKVYTSELITRLLGDPNKLSKGLEIEMSSINLRNILNVINIIVMGFIFIVGLLAIISLISFVRILFEMYFQRIEKNIGTFMAFGINIKVVYVIILNVFVMMSLTVGFITALGFGELIELVIVSVMGDTGSGEVKLFHLFNYPTLIAILLVIIANIWAFTYAAAIFKEWPGDILYKRRVPHLNTWKIFLNFFRSYDKKKYISLMKVKMGHKIQAEK
jgi:hypothetical protein